LSTLRILGLNAGTLVDLERNLFPRVKDRVLKHPRRD
jgi:hypothetical protein